MSNHNVEFGINEEMSSCLYLPIYKKIQSWIDYEENRPKSDYYSNKKIHDEFRAKNDLDCVLRNGNLNADTIFSLWAPLRLSLIKVSDKNEILKVTGTDISKSIDFLKSLISNNNLEKLLPPNSQTTVLLSRLFSLGQQVENTMILPERWLQKRGTRPYYDYMPYFLYECFEGGIFHKAFGSDKNFVSWIIKEDLGCFFDGNIAKETIVDLAETGSIQNGIPKDINILLNNYIGILEKRHDNLTSFKEIRATQ
ncbi:TPA: hypothetical protein ACGOXG_001719 [Streptococcus suis]